MTRLVTSSRYADGKYFVYSKGPYSRTIGHIERITKHNWLVECTVNRTSSNPTTKKGSLDWIDTQYLLWINDGIPALPDAIYSG